MANARVMMLEGSGGLSFFFQETLLEHGLAKQVDRVSQAEQAIRLIKQMEGSHPYNLVIIDLVESWEEGMQLGFWLNQHPLSCPIILILPPETSAAPLTKAPFVAVSAPFSLNDFTNRVRAVLTAEANGRNSAFETLNHGSKDGKSNV